MRGEAVWLGSIEVYGVAAVLKACHRHAAERIAGSSNEASHELVAKHGVSPVRVSGAPTSRVLDGYRERRGRPAQPPVFQLCIGTRERWIVGAGVRQETLARPNGADPDDVAHFMRDHIIQ